MLRRHFIKHTALASMGAAAAAASPAAKAGPCAPLKADDPAFPAWLSQAAALPTFEVLDTRSAQGRLDTRPKKVTMRDLIMAHGHACDGLIRGVYAMRALADVAFPGQPLDRTDLKVVSKNSPCLGDVGEYLTGARVRFGTHTINNAFGVQYTVQKISTGQTWEVKEKPGIFPALYASWEKAMLFDNKLTGDAKANLLGVHEAEVWNWVRTSVLTRKPSDLYEVKVIDTAALPEQVIDKPGTRTDALNRKVPPPSDFSNPYDLHPIPALNLPADNIWVRRYRAGPDKWQSVV